MPTFAFVVRDQQGKEIPSSQSAKNEETLRRGLEAQGYEVVSIVRTKAVGAKRAKASMFKRVKLDQLAQWCRQFATMINAGVSLIRCLTVLQEQTTNPNLRVITRDVGMRSRAATVLRRHDEMPSEPFSKTWPLDSCGPERSAACSMRLWSGSRASWRTTWNSAGRSSRP